MVVILDNAGVSCIRYDAVGSLMSTATFYPPWGAARAAIDPFGAVFIVTQWDRGSSPFSTRGDVWTMKYDGLTGRALWPSPQTWDGPEQRRDEPRAAHIGPTGDLIVTGITYGSANETPFVLKYDGLTAAPAWPPLSISGYSSATAVDAAGDVYLSAFSNGTFHSKYSGATGALVWQTVGPQIMFPVAAQVAAGRLVVTGRRLDSGPRDTTETEAYDAVTGALLWQHEYGDPMGAVDQAPLAVAVGARGEVFVSGVSPDSEYFTLKLSGIDGSVSWGPIHSSSGYQPGLMSHRVAVDGDLLEVSAAYNPPTHDLKVRRYDGASGVIVWGPETTEGSCCDTPVWFIASSGRIFFSTPQYEGTDLDTVSFARDPLTGQFVWPAQRFEGQAGGSGRLNDLTLDPAGNVIVTGNVAAGDSTADWATLKYDHATGAVLWGPVFFDMNTYPSYWPYQVLTDAAGNVIVAGTGQPVENDFRLVVKKYAGSDGSEIWTSGIVSNFTPWGMAIDVAGNPAVLGQALNASQTGYDNAVTKLSGATGLGLWGPILYESGADDYPTSLAIDGDGDLLATGLSYGDEPFAYTLKYSGVSGALLWGPKTIDNARPNFVAVDSAGDAFVTGYQGQEMFTVKYGEAAGAALWGPILQPSSGGASSGYWIAIDGDGDALIAGSYWTDHAGVFHNDIATIKYRGSNGAVLWGPTLFDGPDHRNDYPYSVVLDPAGNPIVAGESEVALRSYRIAAFKSDGATGAPLWGPVLLGEPGRTDVNGLAARDGAVYIGAIVGGTYRTIALVESLGIATTAGDVGPGICGQAYDLTLTAQNGTPAYTWSVVAGTLPSGLTLAADGHVSGIPLEEGAFSFRVRVQDSLGATAERDFTLGVGTAGVVPIAAATDEACQTTLSVNGSWASYEWLPGGEIAPSIVVAPLETTIYGVRLTDAAGCTLQGWVTVAGISAGQNCAFPVISSFTPGSGPASGGTPVQIAGSNFQAGAWVVVGNAPATAVTIIDSGTIAAATPALAPGATHDVAVTNPDGRHSVLGGAWFADFLDVPPTDPFHDDVESIVRAGITAGCGAGNYCPGNPVTRAQMAVFLLKAEHGSAYTPPPCTGAFSDTPCPGPFTDWIEQLADEGVTSGCGGGNYCPTNPVTRAQMAVFLLKTLLTSAYVPPVVAQIFEDVAPGAFAYDWINDLYNRGVTGGCSASPLLYCPGNPNTRGQMAVFLVRTFGL